MVPVGAANLRWSLALKFAVAPSPSPLNTLLYNVPRTVLFEVILEPPHLAFYFYRSWVFNSSTSDNEKKNPKDS